MQYRRDFNNQGNPFASVWGILLVMLFLVSLFFIARFIFRILYFLSPFLFIASLVIDHKVFLSYFSWLRRLYQRDLIMGIGATVLSIFGFPILSAFLLGKALFQKRMKQAEQAYREQVEGKLIDYEEIDESALDLKQLEEPTRQRPADEPDQKNEYEDLF